MELAETSGVVNSVVSQYRYDETVRNVGKQLITGEIGEIFLVRGNVTWKRDIEYFSKGDGWRGNAADVLTNQGIHLLDVILFLLGERNSSAITFSSVNSSVSTYDCAILNMSV